MSNKNIKSLLNLRPSVFSPSVVRNIQEGTSFNGAYQFHNGEFSTESTLGETGSFKYDPQGTGLKSTQQLEIDWTEFSNHTFFNSAQVKVNAAFEKIQNQFPIDGTRKEYEKFFNELTGFEKYVYDVFPKYQSYLFLSRSSSPANGTYVSVKDVAGASFSGVTKKPDGNSYINPGLKSSTFETWLYLPTTTNNNSIIFQKLNLTSSNYHGFSMYLPSTGSTTTVPIGFAIVSGSYLLDISASVKKGQWNHLAVVWDRNQTELRTKFFINHQLVTQSAQIDIGTLNFDSANFYIGSGSAFPRVSTFTPTETLSGAMEEFRLWHSIRTEKQRREFSLKNVFSTEDLALYFKFNEPSGSLSPITIDSSGKGLHGTLYGVGLGIRNVPTASIAGVSPLTYEKLSECPTLLPDYAPIESLRQTMLVSASIYDQENPNLIVKLVPNHYFLEGQLQDALDSETGSIQTELTNDGTPNSTKLGNTQILLMLLYTWATFLDEIKLYIDAFANSMHVDYDNADTVPDQFLQFLASKYGIKLPPMFAGASLDQFINSENIQEDYSNNNYSLQYVQNQIWRRILINLKDFVSSKGTIHSVKSYIRATGIDPDNNFRIREYGGPTSKALKISRETRSEASTMLNFVSGGYIVSPFLSSSRTEPGFPTPLGAFLTNSLGVRVGTTNRNDGLLTSGSWSYEGSYYINPNFGNKQSLVRFVSSGSVATIFLTNLIAYNSGGLTLFVRPTSNVDTVPLSMSVDANLFDGNIWTVSFGRNRGDEIGLTSLSSSYFLRAARQNFGTIVEEYTTSSYYNEYNTGGSSLVNMWNCFDSSLNASGSTFEIGSGSLTLLTSSSIPGLNSTLYVPTNDARLVDFRGKVSQIRFWSYGLALEEWREHVRNFKSIGVLDPKKNFNFNYSDSGSFGKIRMDVSTDQQVVTSSAGGRLTLFDFSQNNFHMSGSSFLASSSVIVPQLYYYSLISPHFDEASTENKVRIRSFLSESNIMNSEGEYASAAPVYEILRSEEPMDNTRFTIDFSIVESLNQDIVNIFSSLDEFDNALGDPSLLYSQDYPKLSFLRDIYFNRLFERINLKNFYEFYKWFNTGIGSFISQLLPRKTKFETSNFVIRSHMLERSKFEYQFYNQYLGDSVRAAQADTLLVQLFVGVARRY
jgi:hypothetical protein